MKIRLLSIVILLSFWSCGDQASNETEQEVTQEQQETTQQQVEEKIIVATYESATSYAARTDYGFSTTDGELLLIEGNTFEQEPIIELPDNMLETGDEIEGPPGANPELVGKSFKLYYKGDNVYKIELVED